MQGVLKASQHRFSPAAPCLWGPGPLATSRGLAACGTPATAPRSCQRFAGSHEEAECRGEEGLRAKHLSPTPAVLCSSTCLVLAPPPGAACCSASPFPRSLLLLQNCVGVPGSLSLYPSPQGCQSLDPVSQGCCRSNHAAWPRAGPISALPDPPAKAGASSSFLPRFRVSLLGRPSSSSLGVNLWQGGRKALFCDCPRKGKEVRRGSGLLEGAPSPGKLLAPCSEQPPAG